MGVFDKYKDEDVKNAEGFGKTPNMSDPGQYLCRIRRHVIGQSRANENKIRFVAEYEIEETTSSKHPEGARRAYIVMLDPGDKKKSASKLGAIKAHLEAVSRTPQSEIDKAFLDDLEAHPFRFEGTLVRLEVSETIKLQGGNDFTPQNWYPYGEDEDEESESAEDQGQEEDIAF